MRKTATESFIRKSVTKKFQSKHDELEKKIKQKDLERSKIVDKINDIECKLDDCDLPDSDAEALEEIGSNMQKIIRNACEKTVTERLAKAGYKFVSKSAVEELFNDIDTDFMLVDAWHDKLIKKIIVDDPNLKTELASLKKARIAIDAEIAKLWKSLDAIDNKVDEITSDIAVRLELGGSYDDLMKMLDAVKA